MARKAVPPQPGSTTPLSPAIIVNGIVYCSGQVGRDPVTGSVPDDIRAQTRHTIENLRDVLHRAGADLSDVTKTTVFLTRQEDFDAMNEIYREFFQEPRPARSTIVVAALARPGLHVEIEAIAHQRARATRKSTARRRASAARRARSRRAPR